MKKNVSHLLAIGIAVLPIHLIMIGYRLQQTENFSTTDMLVYPLMLGGASLILIIIVNTFLLKSTFTATFNSGCGTVWKDVGAGLGLTAVFLVMVIAERAVFMHRLPRGQPTNKEVINVLINLANNPLLLLVWFGPVLWIGISLYEELSRTFLLTCLWNICESTYWHIAVIFLVAALIGVTHLYQGPLGIISIGLKSIVVSIYFYKYHRLLPLVISHGLYDGLQFSFFIWEIR